MGGPWDSVPVGPHVVRSSVPSSMLTNIDFELISSKGVGVPDLSLTDMPGMMGRGNITFFEFHGKISGQPGWLDV